MHSVTSHAVQSVHLAADHVIVIYRFERCSLCRVVECQQLCNHVSDSAVSHAVGCRVSV